MKPDYDTLISQTILLPVRNSRPKLFGLAKLQGKLALYQRHHRTRRQLKSLSHEQLRDIGITAEQAKLEAKKFFWE